MIMRRLMLPAGLPHSSAHFTKESMLPELRLVLCNARHMPHSLQHAQFLIGVKQDAVPVLGPPL